MLERLLILSALLFCIGLYGALTRRHVIGVLIGVELMLNAVNVALVAFSRYVEPGALSLGEADALLEGQAFALFVVVVAAAEVALGLALVIALVRSRDTVDLTEVSLLRR
jgi:NADH:ubiquinone oxidoreductase subunit K